MAKPRVFISSTYYDLKHLRSAIEAFVDSLGFDPVLSEKGAIAYAPDQALDESCYREAKQADIMVLIVGGRYGSERSGTDSEEESSFFRRYDSITRQEFRSAVDSKVPLYVLIERAVYAEYRTFLKNRDSTTIKYAHVDSVNIFKMIEEILSLPQNNPVFSFDRFHDIESWLREQWAGLFQELLQRMSGQEQLSTLAGQVSQLTETSKTLKRYIESLMTDVSPTKSEQLIVDESKRLSLLRRYRELEHNALVSYLIGHDLSLLEVGDAVEKTGTVEEFINAIKRRTSDEFLLRNIGGWEHPLVLDDLNEARESLKLDPIAPPVSRRKPRTTKKKTAKKKTAKKKTAKKKTSSA